MRDYFIGLIAALLALAVIALPIYLWEAWVVPTYLGSYYAGTSIFIVPLVGGMVVLSYPLRALGAAIRGYFEN